MLIFMGWLLLIPGPSTPEDWQKMYESCLQGAAVVTHQQNLGWDFPTKFCACARDQLKSTPERDRDANFPAIRDLCLGRARR